MRVIDLAQFICMIDFALLYTSVQKQSTLELLSYSEYEPKKLKISKQIQYGRLEIVSGEDGTNVLYFPRGSAVSTAHFSFHPTRDGTEIIRDRLMKIIRLDSESDPGQSSMNLDLIRAQKLTE